VEIAFWNSIAQSSDPADFQAYLAQFPNGAFVALAKNRLARLQKTAAPPDLTHPSPSAIVPAPASQPPTSPVGQLGTAVADNGCSSFATGILGSGMSDDKEALWATQCSDDPDFCKNIALVFAPAALKLTLRTKTDFVCKPALDDLSRHYAQLRAAKGEPASAGSKAADDEACANFAADMRSQFSDGTEPTWAEECSTDPDASVCEKTLSDLVKEREGTDVGLNCGGAGQVSTRNVNLVGHKFTKAQLDDACANIAADIISGYSDGKEATWRAECSVDTEQGVCQTTLNYIESAHETSVDPPIPAPGFACEKQPSK
jgi:hypothetical protein